MNAEGNFWGAWMELKAWEHAPVFADKSYSIYIYIFAVATAHLSNINTCPTIRENRGGYFESQTI